MHSMRRMVSVMLLLCGMRGVLPELLLAQKDPAELDETLKLVAMIDGQLGAAPVFGAGIIVGREKARLFIATANHLVRRASQQATGLQVRLRSSPSKTYRARLMPQFDPDRDIAVLSVEDFGSDDFNLCTLRFDRAGDEMELRRGSDLHSVGNPNGTNWGMPVTGEPLATILGDEITFQSPFISVGDSGGALLDAQSRIVAMIEKDDPPFGRGIALSRVLTLVKGWGYPAQLFVPDEDGTTPLQRAASKNDLPAVKQLIGEACANVNVEDAHGRIALHDAADSASPEVLAALIEAGSRIDVRDHASRTPLYYAARRGSFAAVQLLVQHGASAANVLSTAVAGKSLETARFLIQNGAVVNTKGAPPLLTAVTGGSLAMVRLLIDSGADVNAQPVYAGDKLMLTAAAARGDAAIVRALLDAGAKVNAVEQESASALATAIAGRHLDVVELLIAAGADFNSSRPDNDTPLHLAVRTGNLEIVRALIRAGAKVNAAGSLGKVPLSIAIENGDLSNVELLLRSGADLWLKPDGMQTAPGLNALCKAYEVRRNRDRNADSLKSIQTLIAFDPAQAGLLANSPDCTMFRDAARDGDIAVVRLLLNSGVDPNKNPPGPLYDASGECHADVVKLLISAKANLNATDINGYTALHYTLETTGSTSKDTAECVRLLLRAGARVNTVTGFNESTPLHEAVVRNIPEDVIQMMLEAGASVTAKDRYGNTPLSLASSQRPDLVPLLRRYVKRPTPPKKKPVV